jgi:lysyl-tRNA synthetase class 2
MDIEMLRTRARILQSTRAFFDARSYLELDTPVLSPDLIPESCLEIFKTEYLPPAHSARQTKKELYLVPSPEIWMKKIIAQKKIDVYQICKCFRNCESVGHTHSPEFTMLEFYTMNADYLDSLRITEELFSHLLSSDIFYGVRDNERELSPPFMRLTMEDAFKQFAGFSLVKAIEEHTLLSHARRLGITPPPHTSEADLYNLIFIHSVEPALPRGKPVALLDYPEIVPCLAQLNSDGASGASATRERWELYVRGIEMANTYSEETCAEHVRNYFLEEGRVKNNNATIKHNIDDDYWKIFNDFPRCSGVALGMDRLIMAFTGHKTIDGVLPFRLNID